jgi:antitoxin (DNA-binding transcriptional repressor) of toxin-antitoxin stability system
MIEAMGTLRITEAELARDIHAVLAKVQEGAEVIVEQDHRPVPVIRTPQRSGRPISEILRQAKERNSTVTLDPDFGKDLEAVIASHQQPGDTSCQSTAGSVRQPADSICRSSTIRGSWAPL